MLSMTRGALELIVQRGVLHKLQNITDNTSSAPYAVETIEYLHAASAAVVIYVKLNFPFKYT